MHEATWSKPALHRSVGQAVSVNLDKFCDIYIVGAGKAAAGMSAAVVDFEAPNQCGTIIVPYSSR